MWPASVKGAELAWSLYAAGRVTWSELQSMRLDDVTDTIDVLVAWEARR